MSRNQEDEQGNAPTVLEGKNNEAAPSHVTGGKWSLYLPWYNGARWRSYPTVTHTVRKAILLKEIQVSTQCGNLRFNPDARVGPHPWPPKFLSALQWSRGPCEHVQRGGHIPPAPAQKQRAETGETHCVTLSHSGTGRHRGIHPSFLAQCCSSRTRQSHCSTAQHCGAERYGVEHASHWRQPSADGTGHSVTAPGEYSTEY
ncbi:hypothetical protein AAFF_G00186700 [Aldrovandia affinis]|uniref:Uncharacterized protein n=1 Tax=Aldrovandia affinis TaxID=143900 RepID=A0AAD7WVP8_9TELE|nr:hypothetical protein AAFF_G00186700 [Aldrovandia affinis]